MKKIYLFGMIIFTILFSGCFSSPKLPIEPAKFQSQADIHAINEAISNILRKEWRGTHNYPNLLFDITYYGTYNANGTCMNYSEYSITRTIGAGPQRSKTEMYNYCFQVEKEGDNIIVGGEFGDKRQYLRSEVEKIRPRILNQLPDEIIRAEKDIANRKLTEAKRQIELAEAKKQQEETSKLCKNLNEQINALGTTGVEQINLRSQYNKKCK